MESTFEIPLREMLDGLSMNSREAVDRLLEAFDVDYLVAFESADGSNRQLVAVGAELEYTDFDEVAKMQIDDMRASFYANAALATSVRRLSDPKVEPKQDVEDTNARIDEAEQKAAELQERIEEESASKKVLERELDTLRSAVEDESSLKQQVEAIQSRNEQLDYREKELHAMEEAMVSRMNEYMEKMAELEQWEENLFHRENAFKKASQSSA